VQVSRGNRIVIRDAEWIVRSVEPSTDKGYVIEAVGLSPVVKDRTMFFLTALEDSITILKPEQTALVTDLSGEYIHTRLYTETVLRNIPPSTDALTIGPKGAMHVHDYQTYPGQGFSHIIFRPPPCTAGITNATGLCLFFRTFFQTGVEKRDPGKGD